MNTIFCVERSKWIFFINYFFHKKRCFLGKPQKTVLWWVHNRFVEKNGASDNKNEYNLFYGKYASEYFFINHFFFFFFKKSKVFWENRQKPFSGGRTTILFGRTVRLTTKPNITFYRKQLNIFLLITFFGGGRGLFPESF